MSQTITYIDAAVQTGGYLLLLWFAVKLVRRCPYARRLAVVGVLGVITHIVRVSGLPPVYNDLLTTVLVAFIVTAGIESLQVRR